MEDIKSKIRPIYEELQGYLSQCPLPEKNSYISTPSSWKNLQYCIEQLNSITNDNYSRFNVDIKPSISRPGTTWPERVDTIEYRSKLNALIMYLHAKYFTHDISPFGGSPSMIISQTQNTNITMIMDVQTLIDKKLFGENLAPEEKTFLEKLKSSLPTLKSTTDLITTIIQLANACGMSIHTLSKIFG